MILQRFDVLRRWKRLQYAEENKGKGGGILIFVGKSEYVLVPEESFVVD